MCEEQNLKSAVKPYLFITYLIPEEIWGDLWEITKTVKYEEVRTKNKSE